ncbi:hypothetical protein AaE_008389 [Aphanomyces astaci]|uniref:Uncharacterized protein n=1 Tax=Aphanomyces astaci TaxID=112090 RepID=A0A6A5AF20_APHAT|nr:hypothetical protein AaE_008389 [Aphanomyces astaci]
MLRHLLVQEGVDERRIKKLEAKGIRNLKKMFQKSEWELAHIMDLSVDDLQGLLLRIAAKDSPKPSSVCNIMKREWCQLTVFFAGHGHVYQERQFPIVPSDDPARARQCSLWWHPHRDNHRGMIAGAAGIGKSQLCMQLAVLCALEYHDGTVLYFDSGGNFSAKRFMQLATERISPQQYSTDVLRKSKVEAIARQVQVVAVENLDRLETKVRELTESMPLMGKMIIIDSLATLAKHVRPQSTMNSSTDMSVATRQMLLMRVASVLNGAILTASVGARVVALHHKPSRPGEDKPKYEGHDGAQSSSGRTCVHPLKFHNKAGGYDDEFPWDAAMMLGDFDDAQDDGFRLHPVQHASQRDSQSGGIPPDDIASQEEMVAATPSDDEQFDTKVEHLATELGQLEDSRQAARDMALSIVDDIVPASDDEEEE